MRLRRTRVWFFCVCLFPLQPQEAHKWTRAERKKCSENHPFDFNNWKSEFLFRTEAATRFNLDRPQSHTTTSANNTMNNHSFNVSLRWMVGNNDDDKWKFISKEDCTALICCCRTGQKMGCCDDSWCVSGFYIFFVFLFFLFVAEKVSRVKHKRHPAHTICFRLNVTYIGRRTGDRDTQTHCGSCVA